MTRIVVATIHEVVGIPPTTSPSMFHECVGKSRSSISTHLVCSVHDSGHTVGLGRWEGRTRGVGGYGSSMIIYGSAQVR